MKKLFFILFFSIIFFFKGYSQSQIVANHTVVAKFSDIPQYYIDQVKKMWVTYPGESHSEDTRDGMIAFTAAYPAYAMNSVLSGTPEAATTSHLRYSRATWGDIDNSSGWIYDYGEEDWFDYYDGTYHYAPAAVTQTKASIAYCNSGGRQLDATGFCWCWDYNDGLNATWYLTATQAYIDYCTAQGYGTKVFFTTGPQGNGGILPPSYNYIIYQRAQQIRSYVAADSSRILFDWEDILAYNDAGVLATESDGTHTYPSYNTDNDGGTPLIHIGTTGGIRLAKAMWWMLARMAGWDGNTSYYVAPSGGSDSYPGTLAQPWATWQKAFTGRTAGETVYFRGGTWSPTTEAQTCIGVYVNGLTGTHDHPICFKAYPPDFDAGNRPIIDFTNTASPCGTCSGLEIQSSTNIKFKGLWIRNRKQHAATTSIVYGLNAGNENTPNGTLTFEQMTTSGMGGPGFWAWWYDSLYIINCDSHNNVDSLDMNGHLGGFGNGYSIAAKGDPADLYRYTYLRGNRAWENSADGFAISTTKQFYLYNNWAFLQGQLDGDGDGFKFLFSYDTNPAHRMICNNIAANCLHESFSENNLTDVTYGPIGSYYNNTIYHCESGFESLPEDWNGVANGNVIYKNNLVYGNTGGANYLQTGLLAKQYLYPSYATFSNNTWVANQNYPYWTINSAFTATNADFVSLDVNELKSPRGADGSLPDVDFLKLAPGSDLINAGTDVGLPFNGQHPDIGYSESSQTGTTYYISTSGTDGSGHTGLSNDKWRTLAYACSRVTTSGDVIHIDAGTYTETAECILSPGVSIEGAGVTSWIKSHYVYHRDADTSPHAAISLISSSNTDGNQHLSNFKLDGDNETSMIGITVWRRNNVIITNMTIVDFHEQGVSIESFTDPMTMGTRATGCEFSYNIVTNCGDIADVPWTGGGELQIGGTHELSIHHNIFTSNTRTIGHCGDLIQCHPFHEGTKIYNNKFYKRDHEGGEWNFIIEAWNTSGGFEIYDNEFWGAHCAIDMGAKHDLGVGNVKGDYAYSYYVHNNLFTSASGNNPVQVVDGFNSCIDIEGEVNTDIWIFYNHVLNLPVFIVSDNGGGYTYTVGNIFVCYNILQNMGWSGDVYQEFNTFHNEAGSTLTNVFWYNNDQIGKTGTHATGLKIYNESGTITNFNIKNNIFENNQNNGFFAVENSATFTGLYVNYNIIPSANNSSVTPVISGSIGTHDYTNNITNALPPFNDAVNGDFTLTAQRSGTDVSLTLDYGGNLVTTPTIGAWEYGSAPAASSPTVTTTAVTSITTTSASSGGNVTDDGGASVTARGVCWNTSSNPTISGNKTTDGTGTGFFASSITDLSASTGYHVRAYATNSAGTSYGSDISFVTSSAGNSIYYVSTTGNNNNAGTIGSPFATINKAYSVMNAGDITYVRGGTYTYAMMGATELSGRSGSTGNYITIENYPGESPVINFIANTFTSQVFGIWVHDANYIYMKGIRVTSINEPASGTPTYGLILYDHASNCVFEQIETDHIGGWGVHISDYCNNNLFLNCDSHHNSDRYSSDAWGGADGFQSNSYNQGAGETSTGNIFRGCRSWRNSDDGWDLRRADGIWTLENCWSFWNGYRPGERLGDADSQTAGGDGMGLKFGTNFSANTNSITKTAKSCLVFENRASGIDLWTDGGYYYSGYGIYNCTIYGNASGIGCSDASGASGTTLRNNITYQNNNMFYGSPWWVHDHNSWDIPVTVADADFINISSSGMDGARQSDGSLPVPDFLKLSSSSVPEYHAGVAVTGLTKDAAGNDYGTPPSIGAYEVISEGGASVPTVLTTDINSISATEAHICGNVTDDGGGAVSARGICYGSSANPTTAGSKTSNSTGTGIFTAVITGLVANTTYHARGYATNSAGTAYGADIPFKTDITTIVNKLSIDGKFSRKGGHILIVR